MQLMVDLLGQLLLELSGLLALAFFLQRLDDLVFGNLHVNLLTRPNRQKTISLANTTFRA